MKEKKCKDFNHDVNFSAHRPDYFENRRFHPIDLWLKKHFGEKTIKLAIDGGFTCPNRDGTKGFGGCTFCSDSGSGEFASPMDFYGEITSSIEAQTALLSDKWPKAKYLAYFQNHTNTYAPASVLRAKYTAALDNPNISGLIIGTRPDCLPPEAMELLSEISRSNFMWVELGLQTIHEHTAKSINRCYSLDVFDKAAEALYSNSIKYVVHLILGLPGETEDMMMESVRYVSSKPGIFGIKLHLLNIVKGSPMEKTHAGYLPFDSIDSYVDLIVRCLEIIPPQITIHRLTGDAPRSILISPPWSFNKRTILNRIDEQLNLRDTWQGKKSTLK